MYLNINSTDALSVALWVSHILWAVTLILLLNCYIDFVVGILRWFWFWDTAFIFAFELIRCLCIWFALILLFWSVLILLLICCIDFVFGLMCSFCVDLFFDILRWFCFWYVLILLLVCCVDFGFGLFDWFWFWVVVLTLLLGWCVGFAFGLLHWFCFWADALTFFWYPVLIRYVLILLLVCCVDFGFGLFDWFWFWAVVLTLFWGWYVDFVLVYCIDFVFGLMRRLTTLFLAYCIDFTFGMMSWFCFWVVVCCFSRTVFGLLGWLCFWDVALTLFDFGLMRCLCFWDVALTLLLHCYVDFVFGLLGWFCFSRRITGNSIPNETRTMTTNHNLVRYIHIVSFTFLVAILRCIYNRTFRRTTPNLSRSNSRTCDQRTREHSHGCPPTFITRKSYSPSNGQINLECTDRGNPINLLDPSGPKLLSIYLFNIYLFKEN